MNSNMFPIICKEFLHIVRDKHTLDVFQLIPVKQHFLLGYTANNDGRDIPQISFLLAKNIHIVNKAEFTPRNVQATEGRKTTNFEVRLRLDNRTEN
jgi:hypothetical protein